MKKVLKELLTFKDSIQRSISFINVDDLSRLPSILLNDIESLSQIPNVCCIYFLINSKHGILYIGKSKNLYKRWQREKNENGLVISQHQMFLYCMELSGESRLHWLILDEDSCNIIESQFIKVLSPAFNIQGNPNGWDNKISSELDSSDQLKKMGSTIGKTVKMIKGFPKLKGIIDGVYYSNFNVYDVAINWDLHDTKPYKYFPKYEFMNEIIFVN